MWKGEHHSSCGDQIPDIHCGLYTCRGKAGLNLEECMLLEAPEYVHASHIIAKQKLRGNKFHLEALQGTD